MKLFIKNDENFKFLYKKLFRKIVKVIIKTENIDYKVEVNLIIVNNQKMKKMVQKHKGINATTDILAFPADWKKLRELIGYYMLGDIFISYEKIIEQSCELNHSLKREWSYIFAHGIFHLLGYNHIEDSQTIIMNSKVEGIMKIVKVGRND